MAKVKCTCACHTHPSMKHVNACCKDGWIEDYQLKHSEQFGLMVPEDQLTKIDDAQNMDDVMPGDPNEDDIYDAVRRRRKAQEMVRKAEDDTIPDIFAHINRLREMGSTERGAMLIKEYGYTYKTSQITIRYIDRKGPGVHRGWSYCIKQDGKTKYCAWCHMEFYGENELAAIQAGERMVDRIQAEEKTIDKMRNPVAGMTPQQAEMFDRAVRKKFEESDVEEDYKKYVKPGISKGSRDAQNQLLPESDE